MQVIKTLQPGEPGTKRFLPRYGKRLVAVRYRRDKSRQCNLTTIEVIVVQRPDDGISHAGNYGRRRTGWVKLKVDFNEREIPSHKRRKRPLVAGRKALDYAL